MRKGGRRLRPTEVCQRIVRSRSRLYEMINAGDFPQPQRANKRLVYWDEDVVEEWLREHRQELSPPKPVTEKLVTGSRLRVFRRYL